MAEDGDVWADHLRPVRPRGQAAGARRRRALVQEEIEHPSTHSAAETLGLLAAIGAVQAAVDELGERLEAVESRVLHLGVGVERIAAGVPDPEAALAATLAAVREAVHDVVRDVLASSAPAPTALVDSAAPGSGAPTSEATASRPRKAAASRSGAAATKAAEKTEKATAKAGPGEPRTTRARAVAAKPATATRRTRPTPRPTEG